MPERWTGTHNIPNLPTNIKEAIDGDETIKIVTLVSNFKFLDKP